MPATDEILRVLALYTHLLDDQRYDDWAALLTEDAVLTVAGQEHRGRDAVRAFVASIQPDPPGKHFVGLPVIDQTHDDRANVWADMVMFIPGGGGVVAQSMSRYHLLMRRVDGRWRFDEIHLNVNGAPLHPEAPPVPPA